jgi:hypothetical protein
VSDGASSPSSEGSKVGNLSISLGVRGIGLVVRVQIAPDRLGRLELRCYCTGELSQRSSSPFRLRLALFSAASVSILACMLPLLLSLQRE